MSKEIVFNNIAIEKKFLVKITLQNILYNKILIISIFII